MAKQNKTVAAPAKPIEATEENVMDIIRSQNIGEQSIAEEVDKQLKDEKNKRLIEDTKRKVAEAEYNNLKARLMLRKQRKEEAAIKKYLGGTKELLDKLKGYTNEKGEFVSPTLTIFQYNSERDKLLKEKREDFNNAQKQYGEELAELRYQYPNYWSYEWDD